jgi:hypothetical protein
MIGFTDAFFVQSLLTTINYNNWQSISSRTLLPWLPRSRSILVLVLRLTSEWVSESVSYITTDGQSASLSWCQTPIWGLRPEFYYCQTIAGLLMWGALSDEKTGLSLTMYNVQYVYILHVILRYSFTNLIWPPPLSLSPPPPQFDCFPGGPVCYALTRKFEADRI